MSNRGKLPLIIFLVTILVGLIAIIGTIIYRQTQKEEVEKITPKEEAKVPEIYEQSIFSGGVEVCDLEAESNYRADYDPATACLRTGYVLRNTTGEPMTVTYSWITCFCPDQPFGMPPYYDRCFQNCEVFNQYSIGDLNYEDLLDPQIPKRTIDIPPDASQPIQVERCTGQDCGSFQIDFQIYAVNGNTECQNVDPYRGVVLVYLTERECPPTTPTPTPTPAAFQCLDLQTTDENPSAGDSVTYTCLGQGENINHFDFRVNVDGIEGAPVTASASANQATYTFTVSQTGTDFVVQCRACKVDETCTAWGQTE